MAPTPSLAGLQIETTAFPPSVKPPSSSNTLFLGGAGVRGLEIQGNFVKFTAIGVYLEDNAVPQLAVKWKGKTAEELTESVEFFRDIVTGPFEKFIQVTTILPLTGQQYAEKVSENCVAFWKSVGIYTDVEEKAIEKLLEVFKDQNFPPRWQAMPRSILFDRVMLHEERGAPAFLTWFPIWLWIHLLCQKNKFFCLLLGKENLKMQTHYLH